VQHVIALARLLELVLPDLIGETKDRCRELATALLLRRQLTLFAGIIPPAPCMALGIADELLERLRIDTKHGADEKNEQRGTAADGQSLLTETAAILDVCAHFMPFPFHDALSRFGLRLLTSPTPGVGDGVACPGHRGFKLSSSLSLFSASCCLNIP
jgi:hypothetical protein